MNPDRHMKSHYDFYLDLLRGDDSDAEAHRRFYDEYNAVLDMPAEFYLDTIRMVFQEVQLPNGTWKSTASWCARPISSRSPSSPSRASWTTSGPGPDARGDQAVQEHPGRPQAALHRAELRPLRDFLGPPLARDDLS